MKILLVEDEVEIANFISRGLKAEGYHVIHSENAEDALDFIYLDNISAVILDLILPTMSGEDFLKKIRAEKMTVPVIILSAVSNCETKTRLLNAGADDYISKPFSFVELVARLHSVLRRSQGSERQASDKIVVGDLKLIPNMRMVTHRNKPIKLRLREYVLLEYFMRHPNQVISRSTLIENIWDYNAQLFSNTVDSHISMLRKKLDTGEDEKLIETIHGVGYMLRSKLMTQKTG